MSIFGIRIFVASNEQIFVGVGKIVSTCVNANNLLITTCRYCRCGHTCRVMLTFHSFLSRFFVALLAYKQP